MNKETLLLKLENRFIDNFQIKVKELSNGRFIEETNFKIYLKNTKGMLSSDPVMYGKYFAGRKKFYLPWIEVYFVDKIKFESYEEWLSDETLEKLFKELASLLPPGGKLMVPYIYHDTDDALRKGAPPPTTLIGYLMWRVGCTWFKDWYFSEGAWEGDVKIQGNKPFDENHRKKNVHEIYKEVEYFLTTYRVEDEIINDCKYREKLILEDIKTQISDTLL
jgi:hypothetical protein